MKVMFVKDGVRIWSLVAHDFVLLDSVCTMVSYSDPHGESNDGRFGLIVIVLL